MNPKGHPASLVPNQPGNLNALRHGAYSGRALAPRALEIAAALMTAPHAVPLDQIAAEEIASLVAMIETIDADLHRNGLTNKKGEARTLAVLRIRVSGRLERWLCEFGATPASRVEWVGKLSTPDDLVAKLREAMAQPDLEHPGTASLAERVVDDAARHAGDPADYQLVDDQDGGDDQLGEGDGDGGRDQDGEGDDLRG